MAPTRKTYDPKNVEMALGAIRERKISIRKASTEYGVPRSTLQDILSQKYDPSSERTTMSREEEAKIVAWLQECSNRGRGKTKEELALAVQKVLNASGRRTSFTNNKPGRSWFRGFFDRHPTIRLRKTMVLGDHRARVSEDRLRGWFSEVERNLRLDGVDIQAVEARCVFNCDETGFPFHTSGSVVLSDTSNKHPYDVGTDSKHQISVLCCASAAGQLLPPCIIFPGMRWTWSPWDQFKDAHFAHTSNGWMNSEVFLDWLSNTFVPAVQSLPRPVILFVDGHQSHVNIEVHELCRTHNIIYYVLPAHASHIVQPLDLIFYGSIKEEWRKAVRDFKALAQVGSITKTTFTPVFRDVWARCCSAEKLVKAFECSGLHPWDPNRPDYSKCQASLLYGRSKPQTGSQPQPSSPQSQPSTSTLNNGLSTSSSQSGQSSSSPSQPGPSSSFLEPGPSSSPSQPGLSSSPSQPGPSSSPSQPGLSSSSQPGPSSSFLEPGPSSSPSQPGSSSSSSQPDPSSSSPQPDPSSPSPPPGLSTPSQPGPFSFPIQPVPSSSSLSLPVSRPSSPSPQPACPLYILAYPLPHHSLAHPPCSLDHHNVLTPLVIAPQNMEHPLLH